MDTFGHLNINFDRNAKAFMCPYPISKIDTFRMIFFKQFLM